MEDNHSHVIVTKSGSAQSEEYNQKMKEEVSKLMEIDCPKVFLCLKEEKDGYRGIVASKLDSSSAVVMLRLLNNFREEIERVIKKGVGGDFDFLHGQEGENGRKIGF
jgi:uncharacterized protein YkvS